MSQTRTAPSTLTPNQRAVLSAATVLSVVALVIGFVVVSASPTIGLVLCLVALGILAASRVAGWTMRKDASR